jgi:uncharacterized FAD-dependent dehydrogenase
MSTMFSSGSQTVPSVNIVSAPEFPGEICGTDEPASFNTTSRGSFRSSFLLTSLGREGAHWFREKARGLGVQTNYGALDIGCRVELTSAVYDEITAVLYDPKFIYWTPSHQDRTRTFCTNPGGRVWVEEHRGFPLVKGGCPEGREDTQPQLRDPEQGIPQRSWSSAPSASLRF